MNKQNPIKIEDLNPLNDLRNKYTVTLPYSKLNVTILEPTVKTRVNIINLLSDLINSNQDKNDATFVLKFTRKLIEISRSFIKIEDSKNEDLDFKNIELTELLNYIYVIFELLSNNWLLKTSVKCNKCNHINDNVHIYYHEDQTFIKKIHDIQGLQKLHELKFQFADNFEEKDFEVNIDKQRSIKFKLTYPSIGSILNNNRNELVPDILQFIKEFEIYKNKQSIFKYNNSLPITILSDLPESILDIIKSKLNEINYKPIKAYFEYICPNCGNNQEISFDAINYFLYWLEILDELIME